MSNFKTYELDWDSHCDYVAHIKNGEKHGIMIFATETENKLEIVAMRNPAEEKALLSDDEKQKVLDFFGRVIQKTNAPIAFIKKGTTKIFKTESGNDIDQLGFRPITDFDQKMASFLGMSLPKTNWMKIVDNEITFIYEIVETFKNNVEEKFGIYISKISISSDVNEIKLSFLLRERKHAFAIRKNKDRFEFSKDAKTKTFQTKSEFDMIMDEMCEQIEKEHRIDLMMNPSKEHFKRFMSGIGFLGVQTNEQIYAFLRKVFSAEEIEKKSKELLDDSDFSDNRWYVFEKVDWLAVFGFFFIITKSGHVIHMFREKDYEQAVQFTSEWVEKELIEQARLEAKKEKENILSMLKKKEDRS